MGPEGAKPRGQGGLCRGQNGGRLGTACKGKRAVGPGSEGAAQRGEKKGEAGVGTGDLSTACDWVGVGGAGDGLWQERWHAGGSTVSGRALAGGPGAGVASKP